MPTQFLIKKTVTLLFYNIIENIVAMYTFNKTLLNIALNFVNTATPANYDANKAAEYSKQCTQGSEREGYNLTCSCRCSLSYKLL